MNVKHCVFAAVPDLAVVFPITKGQSGESGELFVLAEANK